MWRQGSASPHGTSAVGRLQCWSIVVVSVVLEHACFTLPVRLACMMMMIATEQDNVFKTHISGMAGRTRCSCCEEGFHDGGE